MKESRILPKQPSFVELPINTKGRELGYLGHDFIF